MMETACNSIDGLVNEKLFNRLIEPLWPREQNPYDDVSSVFEEGLIRG